MNSNNLIIALAQIPIVDGDIEANLKQHHAAIVQAAELGADLVVFPELSLTGYTIERAADLALNAKHSILRELSEYAVTHQISVIAGLFKELPARKPTISAVVCNPTGELDFYAKQYLHGSEEEHCSAGHHNHCMRLKGYKLTLAVCADFCHPRHSSEAGENEVDVYIASALVSHAGYDMDAEILSEIAKDRRFTVLLSNHIGETGGWQAAGNSAVWNSHGKQMYNTGSQTGCIGLVEITGQDIVGQTLALDANTLRAEVMA